MKLQDLKKLAYKLSFSERLELAEAIIQSLQDELSSHSGKKNLFNWLTEQATRVDSSLDNAESDTRIDKHFLDKYLR